MITLWYLQTILRKEYILIRNQTLQSLSLIFDDWLILLIDWCLTPTLALFQSYRGIHFI